MRFDHRHTPRVTRRRGFLESFDRLAAPLICGIVFTVACGGESADVGDTAATSASTVSATSGPANACALLPASDVTAVLGEPVRDSVALLMTEGDRILSQCNYASASTPVAASLMIRRSAPGETPAQQSKGTREVMTQSGATVQDVPGLGEVAFWGADQLHVFTNNWYLIASPTASGGLAQARALVERAMALL